jgi:hypothetical protein
MSPGGNAPSIRASITLMEAHVAVAKDKEVFLMAANTQSRKWALVINNPIDCGLDHGGIISILHMFCPDYFCLADEIAETGTFHTHVFLYSHSPIRFSTVKGRFPTAHIDKANGTAKANRDYIRKEGKWADDRKSETSVAGSFVEWGTLPQEGEEKNPRMYKLLQNVKDGLTTMDIINESPSVKAFSSFIYAFSGLRYHGIVGIAGDAESMGVGDDPDVDDNTL